jgi:hypothetical protein
VRQRDRAGNKNPKQSWVAQLVLNNLDGYYDLNLISNVLETFLYLGLPFFSLHYFWLNKKLMFYDTSTESSSLLDFLQPRKPSRPGRGAT